MQEIEVVLTKEERQTLYSVLEAYKQTMMDKGMTNLLPKQLSNITSILYKLKP